jgi:PTH1 family peptidyl-tRNA hydrolase
MTKLIIGLGNPGNQYNKTRHNAGFIVLDRYIELKKINMQTKDKFLGDIGIVGTGSEKVIFLKPNTYMNLSGQSISKVIQFYDISTENILIFVDDIYLDVGVLRLREKGGHGGQNGLKSIIDHLQTQDFKRVRFGIGENKKIPLDQYVLSNFSQSEAKTVEHTIISCLDIIENFINNTPFVDIMTRHNSKKQ